MPRKADTTVDPDKLPPNFDASYPLPDSRQEMFAQCLSDGMTQVAAYETAGYVAQSSNANLMARRPCVNARVDWLKRRKAEQAGLTFAGEIVVDLARVDGTAPKGSPEWFLHQVFSIADGSDDMAKVSDKLKALQMAADWMGYFKENKGLKTKEPGDAPQAVGQDSTRRIVAGSESALSTYSEIVDGIGSPSKEQVEDGIDGSDHGRGGLEATEPVEQQ